jgi:hypothetical protein
MAIVPSTTSIINKTPTRADEMCDVPDITSRFGIANSTSPIAPKAQQGNNEGQSLLTTGA